MTFDVEIRCYFIGGVIGLNNILETFLERFGDILESGVVSVIVGLGLLIFCSIA